MRQRCKLTAMQLCIAVLFVFSARAQKFSNLAATPPMGWNSWNKFACKGLNEKVVRETADSMASNGMKDVGYQFVIIDDCWQTGRDAAGNIVGDVNAHFHKPHATLPR